MLVGLAGSLFGTVFNLYLWDLNFTLLDISVLNVIPASISLLSARFFGKWADTSGRKKFVVVGMLFVTAAYTLFFLMIRSNTVNYLYLVFIFLIMGLGGSINSGALLAVATTMVERNKSGTSFGTYLSANAVGWTLGSFLSGMIVDRYGMDLLLLSTTLIYVIGLIVFSLGFVEESVQRRRVPLKSLLRSSWSLSIEGNTEALALIYIITAIFALGSSIYHLAFSIKIYILFGSKTLYGYIMGIAGISNIVSPHIAGRIADKTSKERLLLGGMLTRDIYMAYLSVSWNKVATIIFMIAPFWVLIYVPMVAMTTDYSARGHESEIQSLRGIIANASNVLGSLLAGIIARIYDVRHNIRSIDIILMIGTIIYFLAAIPALKLNRNFGSIMAISS